MALASSASSRRFYWTYCIWKRWKPQPQLFPELFLRLVRQDRLARLPSNKFEIQEQGKAMKVTRRIGTIASLAMWELQLTAPNGNSITRRYLARSNMEASWYAVGEFPNARVGTARKLRRRGRDFT